MAYRTYLFSWLSHMVNSYVLLKVNHVIAFDCLGKCVHYCSLVCMEKMNNYLRKISEADDFSLSICHLPEKKTKEN